CVLSSLCAPNIEFQLLNPTTQLALFSLCIGNCSTLMNITWNIYQGITAPLSTIQWTLFNQTNQYENIYFFGINTNNFTTTNQLYLDNSHVIYWRFEVVYRFQEGISSSAVDFMINPSPQNGSCSISSLNGTTSTLFSISCVNWFDENGIKDYTLYGYTGDRSEQEIIGFSSVSYFDVRLPGGDDNTSLLHLFIVIRDRYDCKTEYNMSSVIVTIDTISIEDFVNTIQNSPNESA
ncbi:unnamed protein product, partial [Adineta steineri]